MVSMYAYPNIDLPLAEKLSMPVLHPYGFSSGSGKHITELLYARWRSKSVARAEEADVAVAFLTHYHPPYHQWNEADRRLMRSMGEDRVDYIPNRLRVAAIHMCLQLGNETLMERLLPMVRQRPRLASRHVLLTPYSVTLCDNERAALPPSWTLLPWIRPLLVGLDFDSLAPRASMAYVERENAVHARSVSLPYVSSVRWSPLWDRSAGELEAGKTPPSEVEDLLYRIAANSVPPWRSVEKELVPSRTILSSFVGTLRGSARASRMRATIKHQCVAHSPRTCVAVSTMRWNSDAVGERRASVEAQALERYALSVKRSSVFCFEPPGFSEPRKSLVDSLLSGCIPVMFLKDDQYAKYMPHFWGDWLWNATIRVPPDDLLEDRIDLIRFLKSIDSQTVRRLQTTIAEHAHTLHYSINGVGSRGDAVTRLERVLKVFRPHTVF